MAWATIKEVGTQLEAIPPVVMGQMKLPNPELALPVDITLPPSLKIRAGELVDVVLRENFDYSVFSIQNYQDRARLAYFVLNIEHRILNTE